MPISTECHKINMLSLYLHIPFCVRKCLYCGFYSTPYLSQHADDYITALRLESLQYRDNLRGKLVNSVYIGGGTPTTLSCEQWTSVMSIIREGFPLSEPFEFTVEANPNTATVDSLAFLQKHGVNRLSIGIQSFSDTVLAILGRVHTAAQAEESFMMARNAGFQNIGIDLIYGVPGQTSRDWENTVDRALKLGPEHISTYCLSLDEGSHFLLEAEAGNLALPDDDATAGMYNFAVREFVSAGYRRYEISNFSIPGYECRHNMNYWERGEYLGLGPGSWSFLSGRRYHNVADVHEYSRRLKAGLPVSIDEEIVDTVRASEEAIMLGLRTAQGVDLRRYELEFGREALFRLEAGIVMLRNAGLVSVKDGRLMLTERGILLSNEAFTRLFP